MSKQSKKPLTIKTCDLEDLSSVATSLVVTLMAYPGVCPNDAGVGQRQVSSAKEIVALCDKIAAENGLEFKRTSTDDLIEELTGSAK